SLRSGTPMVAVGGSLTLGMDASPQAEHVSRHGTHWLFVSCRALIGLARIRRTPKGPKQSKHQFAIWYICGLPRRDAGPVPVATLTPVDTIPYSQFEQLVDRSKIAEVLVGQETVQGILKERFPDGRKMFYAVRVQPELADKLRAHSVVITGAPSSLTFWRSLPF